MLGLELHQHKSYHERMTWNQWIVQAAWGPFMQASVLL